MYNMQPYAVTDMTLDIRPSVVLLLRIVLIQLLAANLINQLLIY